LDSLRRESEWCLSVGHICGVEWVLLIDGCRIDEFRTPSGVASSLFLSAELRQRRWMVGSCTSLTSNPRLQRTAGAFGHGVKSPDPSGGESAVASLDSDRNNPDFS
jgi:hypothetical protein